MLDLEKYFGELAAYYSSLSPPEMSDDELADGVIVSLLMLDFLKASSIENDEDCEEEYGFDDEDCDFDENATYDLEDEDSASEEDVEKEVSWGEEDFIFEEEGIPVFEEEKRKQLMTFWTEKLSVFCFELWKRKKEAIRVEILPNMYIACLQPLGAQLSPEELVIKHCARLKHSELLDALQTFQAIGTEQAAQASVPFVLEWQKRFN